MDDPNAHLDPAVLAPFDEEIAEMRRWATALEASLDAVREHARAIASDSTSVLFAMLLRIHHDHGRACAEVINLLQHHHAGRAVRAILHDPGRNWTLNELAFRAHTSRATLVRTFRKFANIAPLRFLTELRLELASRKLSATNLTLTQIAAEIGYQSESAFSRAFARRYGLPPRKASRHCNMEHAPGPDITLR